MKLRIAASAVLATALLTSIGCAADTAKAAGNTAHTPSTAVGQSDTVDNPIWDDGGPRF